MHKMTIKNSRNYSVLYTHPHLFLKITTMCQHQGERESYDLVLMRVTYLQLS